MGQFALLYQPILASAPPLIGGYSFYVDAGNISSYPGSGTSWYDLSGNNNTVTLNNSPTPDIDGGGSFDFNGSNQYGVYAYSSSFDFSGSGYTMEVWVQFANFVGSGPFPIVWSKDTNGSNFDWCISPSDLSNGYNNKLLQLTAGTSQSLVITTSTMATNTWYHICYSGTGGTTTMYINGVSQGSGAISITNADLSFGTIGCASWNNPGLYLQGKLSICRAYTTGLSSSDVLNNFNSQKSRFGY